MHAELSLFRGVCFPVRAWFLPGRKPHMRKKISLLPECTAFCIGGGAARNAFSLRGAGNGLAFFLSAAALFQARKFSAGTFFKKTSEARLKCAFPLRVNRRGAGKMYRKCRIFSGHHAFRQPQCFRRMAEIVPERCRRVLFHPADAAGNLPRSRLIFQAPSMISSLFRPRPAQKMLPVPEKNVCALPLKSA